MEAEGLPTGANAEIAVCLLRAQGLHMTRATATEMTTRARDLVGEQAALALLQLAQTPPSPRASPRRRQSRIWRETDGRNFRRGRQARAEDSGKQQGKKSDCTQSLYRHEYEIGIFEVACAYGVPRSKPARAWLPLTDTFLARDGEAWIHGMHPHPYTNGGVER